jgi:DNA polymerase-4
MSSVAGVLAGAPQRTVIHMDLDSFFVSVECLRNASLKGKPLVVGGSGNRGVVASCSYEARAFGVRSAMPVRLARQLCPDMVVISGDMESYSKYSRLITDIIRSEVPLFEKASIDEFYIDATGMDRFFHTRQWAVELRSKIIRESGLPLSMGLSANKMVSKVATGTAKPNNTRMIDPGTEMAFLEPMPIERIPMIGEKTAAMLHRTGVYTVGMLRQIPLQLLENMLGKAGPELWRRAHGIDSSPVVPYSEEKSISTETTFERDTIDVHMLHQLLTAMVEELAFKLRRKQKLCACITVKLRYSSFDTVSRQLQIPYTASDHVLMRHAHELFDKLYDRRLLVRLIGVRLSQLVHGNHQISLFDEQPEHIRLYQAMDTIRTKYGDRAVARLSGYAATLPGHAQQRDVLTRFRNKQKH